MRPLWRVGLDAVGRRRAALVVGCTAVVSGLLLVGASIVQLTVVDRGVDVYREPGMLRVVAEPGTRAGVVFGVALACVPLLLLLDQAVRLGSADRRRRVAALQVAGATRRDLGRLGMVEVGVPAAAGALLGIVVWALLRQLLGVWLLPQGAAIVPVVVGPGPWVPVVVAALAAYGVLVGRRPGTRAAVLADTGGIGRGGTGAAAGAKAGAAGGPRGLARPPRPWGLLWLAAGILLMLLEVTRHGRVWEGTAFVGVGLLVLGLATLAPVAAHLVAGVVARRARSGPTLLAARRLQVDARPAGRAAAAVGAVAMALGVVGAFVPETLAMGGFDRGYYLVPALLVGIIGVVAAALVAASLAVHTTETVLDRRRQLATLVATGVPVDVVARSQRLECLLATLPLALVAAVAGGAGYVVLAEVGGEGWLGAAVGVLAALAVVAGAVTAAIALLRPWVEAALGPQALRTE